MESKTLQGVMGELVLDRSGQYHLENTTLDFQKLTDKEILRIAGPLGADFTVKVRGSIFLKMCQFKCLRSIFPVSCIDRWIDQRSSKFGANHRPPSFTLVFTERFGLVSRVGIQQQLMIQETEI